MIGGGVLIMAQASDQTDQDFVTSLKTSISGIYYTQVEHYTAAKVMEEYRKAVQDRELLGDEVFMENLFFLVRKKEIMDLRVDVRHLASSNRLKPRSQVSALKTLFAIGDENDRSTIDNVMSQALATLVESSESPAASPYVAAAERIGGPRTLVALERLHTDAVNHQRASERQHPDNPELIGQLDKVRASLEAKVFTLSRKQNILRRPPMERTAELARTYLQRSTDLSCWSHKELLSQPSPGAVEIVKTVVAHEIGSFLPAGGLEPRERARLELDLRLRGIALLEDMKAPLQPEDETLLRDNFQMILSRGPFFHPQCDWEDVLDEI
jgi:hypothetical protein